MNRTLSYGILVSTILGSSLICAEIAEISISSPTNTTPIAPALTDVENYDSPPLPQEIIGISKPPLLISDLNGFEIVSDPETEIAALFVQVQMPEDPFLSELLKAIRKDIKVIIMAKDEEIASRLWENLSKSGRRNLKNRLRFILNGNRPIKKWARDPFIVMHNSTTKQMALVPAYPNDNWGPNWISRLFVNTDVGLGFLVDNKIQPLSTWYVEGGGVTADDTYVYVGSDTINASMRFGQGPRIHSFENVVQEFERLMKRRVIVLDPADRHSDRYHIPIGKTTLGERTSLLADPVALLKFVQELSEKDKKEAVESIIKMAFLFKDKDFLESKEGRYFLFGLQSVLDRNDLDRFFHMPEEEIDRFKQSRYVKSLKRVEAKLKNEGIAVVRVPSLSYSFDNTVLRQSKGGKLDIALLQSFFPFGLYYTNIIQDNFRGERSVIIPKYGIKQLDKLIYEKYKLLGCFSQIHQIPNVVEGTQLGGPRCRVQVFGFPADGFKKKSQTNESSHP